MRTLDLGPVLVGHVGWGADVAIECDYPGAVEVNLPVTGHLESRGRFAPVTSVPGQATVFRADTPSLITHWDATCTVIGVKFDRSWLEVEAERVLACDRVRTTSLLPEQLSFDDAAGRAWLQLIQGIATHVSPAITTGSAALFRQQLAATVATGFLIASLPDGPGAGPARPRAVQHVVDALHDAPERPWSAGELAAIAGTSVRRLQEGFRQWVGCSPLQYLTDVRLQRAHADLQAGHHPTVADVAATWGFSSASRFAAAYRRRYGVPPAAQRR